MGRIIVGLLTLTVTPTVLAASIYDIVTVKQGILNADETWSGKVLLLGDVVVPPGVTLTIETDTWLIYNGADLNNRGEDAAKPELIVKGHLIRKGDADRIRLTSMADAEVRALLQGATSEQGVKIMPQPVDLSPLQTHWQTYSRRYAILWAVIYSLWLVI